MNIDEAKAERIRLEAELAQANDDVALFNRLKNAAGEVKRITLALQTNANDLHAAEVALANAEHKALAASIRNLRISLVWDGRAVGNLSRAGVQIAWEAPSYDHSMHETGWATFTYQGFAGLAPSVMRYIVEVKPDALPAEIANLAPGDPYEAINRYLRSMHAGHFGE